MVVIDASAYLAYLRDEGGACQIEKEIATHDVSISTVNVVELLDHLGSERPGVAQALDDLLRTERSLPRTIVTADRTWQILSPAIAVEPFTDVDAARVAMLRTHTAGLSFGGRACLALAHRLGGLAITIDPTWRDFDADVIGVEITVVEE